MIFPKNIKHGDSIGVVATSSGIVDPLKEKRVKNAALNLRNAGYEVIFTRNVFTADEFGRSSSGDVKGKQFNDLIANPDVTAILAPSGGETLMEMLDHVDFEKVKENPKWFEGFSDNTGLVFPIVTKCDIAAIYGCHISDFGMKPWEDCVKNALGILEGNIKTQNSFEYHEDDFHDYETGLEGYWKDKKVNWVNARGEDEIKISGRLIGGCLDVIKFLLGTKYDGTSEFIEKYKDDGIIWALETFAMSDDDIISHLWQMRELGYFKYTKGFVIGREMFYESMREIEFKEAVMMAIGDLDVPIIFDADIGHKGPQFSWIMGAKAEITSKGGKGTLTYID